MHSQVYRNLFKRHSLPDWVAEVVQDSLLLSTTPKQKDTLKNDLGADSLDKICILCHLEQKFDIQIPDDTEVGWKTVADITSYLENRLFGSE